MQHHTQARLPLRARWHRLRWPLLGAAAVIAALAAVVLVSRWWHARQQVAGGATVWQLSQVRVAAPDTLLRRPGFDLHFNPQTHMANVAVWELTAGETAAQGGRRGGFRADPAVAGSASPQQWAATGNERGHLVPAADLAADSAAVAASMLMTNIVPQHPQLNRGAWLALEQQCRAWAQLHGAVMVLAGPVPAPGQGVPGHYFKIVVSHRTRPMRAIAFVLPNADRDVSLADCAATVQQVSQLTGITFFAAVPQPQRQWLLQQCNPLWWLGP